jgi:predicted MPP superfamily phosphohydrolase
LVILALAKDLAKLLSLAGGPRRTRPFRKFLSAPKTIAALVAIGAFLSGWSLYQTVKVPEVTETQVTLRRWPSKLDGFKVAILSDLHYCLLFDQEWSEKVVEKTNELKADMVLITGDLVDGTVETRTPEVTPLLSLESPYGTYAIVGNHEYISGYKEWLVAFKEMGLPLLINSHIALTTLGGASFVLAGVTDTVATRPSYGGLPGPDLKKALEGMPEDLPVILMDHRPGNGPSNAQDGRVDLMLSGHTHGGMMPILASIMKKLNNGYLRGWYDIGSMRLYVHRGTGLWSGFPVRLACPSEITLLTIYSGQKPA